MVREGLPEEVAIALYSPDVQVETEREERATCAKALAWGYTFLKEGSQGRGWREGEDSLESWAGSGIPGASGVRRRG